MTVLATDGTWGKPHGPDVGASIVINPYVGVCHGDHRPARGARGILGTVVSARANSCRSQPVVTGR